MSVVGGVVARVWILALVFTWDWNAVKAVVEKAASEPRKVHKKFSVDAAESAGITPSLYTPDDDFEDIEYSYYSPLAAEKPPPCISNASDLVFDGDIFLVAPTLQNCIDRVPGSSFIPIFWNGTYHGQLPIYTKIVMNNLVGISEVDSVVELTFDLTLQWVDHRYAMPLFWEQVPMGFVDLTSTVIGNDNIVMWLPSPAFPDAIEIDIFNQDLRINRANQFYWQVSYHVRLVQPQFNFARYPSDQQNINIRFADAEFELRQLKFIPTGIEFTTLPNGEICFNDNPIWDYLGSDYTSYEDEVYQNSYNVYEIQVVRRAYGVVIRLVLPMALLIFLGVITYWVLPENRLDVTLTILFAMSALYIVILQNIPLVGYLTDVDKYVFWMYFMLVLMAALHQLYATLSEKLDRWPLRLVYLRLIEVSGRVFTLPAVVIYFAVYIPVSDNPDVPTLLIVLSVCIGFVVFVRESFGIRSSVYDAMRALTEKVNDPNLRVEDLSWVEAVALNVFYFKTLSTSKLLVSQHLATHGSFVVKVRRPLHLKNLSNFMSLLQGQNKADNQGPKQKETGAALHLSRVINTGNANGWRKGRNNSLIDHFINGYNSPHVDTYTEDDFRQIQESNALSSNNPLVTGVNRPNNAGAEVELNSYSNGAQRRHKRAADVAVDSDNEDGDN